MAYEQAMIDAGVKVDGCALREHRQVTTLRVDPDGQRLVTSGPSGQAGQYVGGYVVLKVPDREAALDWAARSPGIRGGRIEVRPLGRL